VNGRINNRLNIFLVLIWAAVQAEIGISAL